MPDLCLPCAHQAAKRVEQMEQITEQLLESLTERDAEVQVLKAALQEEGLALAGLRAERSDMAAQLAKLNAHFKELTAQEEALR